MFWLENILNGLTRSDYNENSYFEIQKSHGIHSRYISSPFALFYPFELIFGPGLGDNIDAAVITSTFRTHNISKNFQYLKKFEIQNAVNISWPNFLIFKSGMIRFKFVQSGLIHWILDLNISRVSYDSYVS